MLSACSQFAKHALSVCAVYDLAFNRKNAWQISDFLGFAIGHLWKERACVRQLCRTRFLSNARSPSPM